MSAFLSLVLASALTVSFGNPVADSYSATTSVSQDLLSSTGSVSSLPHPTYYVRSDLHDSWEKENKSEKIYADEFDFGLPSNQFIEHSTSLMDRNEDFFIGKYSGFTSIVDNANLYLPTIELDSDYYTFSLYAQSMVSISCLAPSATDRRGNPVNDKNFDFAIYGLVYGQEEGESYSKSIKTLFSDSGKSSFSFSSILSPGTYYVQTNHTYTTKETNKINYNLTVEADYLHVSKSYDIASLRYNKGIKAALWSSDYRPFQQNAFANLTCTNAISRIDTLETEHCFWNYSSNDQKPDFATKDLGEFLSGRSIYSDILYVWDNDVAALLCDSFASLAIEFQRKGEEIERKAEEKKGILKTTQITYETFSDGLSLILDITGVSISLLIPLPKALTAIGLMVVEKIIDYVFSSLENVYDAEGKTGAEMKNVADYFREISSSLSVKKDTEKAQGAPEKVIRIPLGAFRTEKKNGPLGEPESEWAISGAQTLVDLFNLNFEESLSLVYDEDSISTMQGEGTLSLIGNVYAFDAGNGTSVEAESCPDVMHPYQTITNIHTLSIAINRGDYAWYRLENSGESRALCVLVTDSEPICLEPYHEQIPGFSPESRNEIALVGAVNEGADRFYYAFYDFYLPHGEDIYFRISPKEHRHVNKASLTWGELETIKRLYTDSENNPFLADLHIHELTFYSCDPLDKDYQPTFSHCHFCWKGDLSVIEQHEFGSPYTTSDGKMYSSCLHCHHRTSVAILNPIGPNLGTLPIYYNSTGGNGL